MSACTYQVPHLADLCDKHERAVVVLLAQHRYLLIVYLVRILCRTHDILRKLLGEHALRRKHRGEKRVTTLHKVNLIIYVQTAPR